MKAPSTNIQAPEKLQASTSKQMPASRGLELGYWNFSGAWMLEFGV
jgi:hypothetical protein